MKHLSILFVTAFALTGAVLFASDYRTGIDWPEPAVVTPGAAPSDAPSDAIVLFDGTNLDAWNESQWKVADGVLTVEPGTGDLRTKQKFGSVQIHLEFATPPVDVDADGNPTAHGQSRGNSGLFFMDHYEVQILDSYENETYFDGQCASIYKQNPPLVNVCKAPGEWQTYDVIFHRPILRIENDQVAEVIRPATITVFQNGVLVVDNWSIWGDTYYDRPARYEVHGDKEPIHLQDHGNRMKFRNIWVREIPDSTVVPFQSRIQYYND